MADTIFKSEKESDRFKMNILRVNIENLNTKDLNKAIINNDIDLTILRMPCENISQISKLETLGYSYYQTDTLVYYFVNLESYLPRLLTNHLTFRIATLNDSDIISVMVGKIFPGYTNHYNANPHIDRENVLEGYKEWVLDFIEKENKFVFLVSVSDEIVGFASCSVFNEEAEGVLFGVLPQFAGGGIYSDIIRYTQQFMKDIGIKKMMVSTQVQNYAVQKVWSREGFSIFKSFVTIHINSLLNYTYFPKLNFDIIITEDDIKNYGNLSGDINQIHYNDAFAKNLGFDKRIAHGLIANAEISKYFGINFPGNGTIFLSYNYKFFRPLYPNEKYKVKLTTPYFDETKNLYVCLVKIFDDKNNLCLLSYNYLIKK